MLTSQMPRFLASHAADPDWRQAAERCLAALHPIPSEATLGFLYATDHLASELSAILGYLKERTGVGHWVGSVGHGICASAMEYHDRPALSMMLGCFPAGSFQVFGLTQGGRHVHLGPKQDPGKPSFAHATRYLGICRARGGEPPDQKPIA